jgi:hypothetical protein
VTGQPPGDPGPPAGFFRPYFRAGVTDESGPATPAEAEPAAAVGGLRPFLLTEGRVASSIPIEAQVVATDAGRAAARGLRAEHRDIIELCFDPLAVAEIGAHLSMHVGVVRVLVEDLSRNGYLRAYLPDAATATDEQVLRRLIDGLRAIS